MFFNHFWPFAKTTEDFGGQNRKCFDSIPRTDKQYIYHLNKEKTLANVTTLIYSHVKDTIFLREKLRQMFLDACHAGLLCKVKCDPVSMPFASENPLRFDRSSLELITWYHHDLLTSSPVCTRLWPKDRGLLVRDWSQGFPKILMHNYASG